MKLTCISSTFLALLGLQGIAVAQDYEYIIVGAGSAGSIVAGWLARAGADVLLIEAGGDNFNPAIESLHQYFNVAFNSYNYGFMQWDYSTTEQTMKGASLHQEIVLEAPSSKVISLPRGKVLGGTHSINAAAYVQANAEDFNLIAEELGDSEWDWKFTKNLRSGLEERLGGILELGIDQVGASDFIETANEVLGFPFNPDPTNGIQYGISPSFWTAKDSASGGRRQTSFDSFVLPLLGESSRSEDSFRFQRGTVDVVTFHMVEHLIFDPTDATRVLGVSCHNLRSNTPTEFYATGEVIVSSGTYNSPQLLQVSGIGPKQHLEEMGIDVKLDLPGVGENLRDHYGVATYWNLVGLPATSPFLFQSPTLNMFGPEPEGQTSYQMELSGNFGSCVPLRQESAGTVRLQSNSSLDAPLIDPNVLSTSNDVEALVVCLRDFLLPFFKGLIAKDLLSPGNIDPDASDEDLQTFVINNIGTNHHPVGTCKVGSDLDELAVVDKNFLVRGMSNLRVIDASVFPKVPSGNTNAPTMTVAMLGARKILRNRVRHRKKNLRGH
jgi:choline dehydrogenase